MKLTKGTILKARGGWDAEVIWIVDQVPYEHNSKGFYAIHRAAGKHDSAPFWHYVDGQCQREAFSINAAPVFNGHPADLEMGEYEL